jgi:hypothetical protein
VSVTSPARNTIGDEVELDFDSAPGDIAAGATAISRTFIQNNRVRGELLDSAGAIVAAATATCRVR